VHELRAAIERNVDKEAPARSGAVSKVEMRGLPIIGAASGAIPGTDPARAVLAAEKRRTEWGPRPESPGERPSRWEAPRRALAEGY
jgi:hypothetical protein